MSLFDLKLGGLGAMSVATLAVAAYGGHLGQFWVEVVGIILSIFSGSAYIAMHVDRYFKAKSLK